MKIDRKKLEWFLQNIRRENQNVTDTELVDRLARWMEVNPDCINMDEPSDRGRYSYSTVGYGVMTLLGEKYRMGRIEIFDREDESGYQVDEGDYCMPFIAANQFEDWIEALETDLPIQISIGNIDWCQQECAKALGFENKDEMNDKEKVAEYRRKKNDTFAKEQGYEDWDDLLAKSKWTKKVD